jgi:beta-phosphoglucomutase-like phosphatase (HAD superfamily)
VQVTSTSREDVVQLLDALDLSPDAFDCVLHRERVERPKPDPDAYLFAREHLRVSARDVLCIEDNPDEALAAVRSGAKCLAFPGRFHDPSSFTDVLGVQSNVDVRPYLQHSNRDVA